MSKISPKFCHLRLRYFLGPEADHIKVRLKLKFEHSGVHIKKFPRNLTIWFFWDSLIGLWVWKAYQCWSDKIVSHKKFELKKEEPW